jgi:[ribosomal protein S18]-alanine N-acetyltransferase
MQNRCADLALSVSSTRKSGCRVKINKPDSFDQPTSKALYARIEREVNVSAPHQIRNMEAADLADVMRLETRAFGPETWTESDFVELRSHLDGTFLVAALEDRLMGYVCGMVYAIGPQCVEGYVASLAVDPDCRRMGLGTALMDAIRRRFVERGVTRLALHVRNTNVAALELYHKLGFKVEKVMPGYCEDGAPAYLMLRRSTDETGVQ